MKEKTKLKIVNAITSLRIAGTILLPAIISAFGPVGIATYILALWLTDFVDGPIARKWDVSTLFGSLLDAFSDKLFSFAVFAYLISINPLFIISALGELGILATNIIGGVKGVDVKSSYIGKGKTFVLGATTVAAVLSTIFSAGFFPALTNVLIPLTIGVQGITLGDYITKIEVQDRKKRTDKVDFRGFFENLKDKEELKEALFSPEFFEENKDKSLKEKVSKDTKKTEEIKNEVIEEIIEPIKEIIDNPEECFSVVTKNLLKSRYLLDDEQIAKLEKASRESKLSQEEFLREIRLYFYRKEQEESASYAPKDKPKTYGQRRKHKNS